MRKQKMGLALRTTASRKRSGTESNARGVEKRRIGESSGECIAVPEPVYAY